MTPRAMSTWSSWRTIVPGVALVAVLAVTAKVVSQELGVRLLEGTTSPVSPVLCAVIIGVVWRNVVGVGRRAEQGLQWAIETLLRAGIALVGLRLTFDGLTSVAAQALPVVIGCIILVVIAALAIGRALKIPRALQLLIAAGTAICGCTAIAATASAIRARPAEVGLALSCIVLFGCLGMVTYPWLAHAVFGASPHAAAIFLGTSIHDTSQVIGASLIYAQQFDAPDAVALAGATKLLRNVSILFLVPLAAWWNRAGDPSGPVPGVVPGSLHRSQVFPGFVIAFVLFVIVRTIGDYATQSSASAQDAWLSLISAASACSELLLICGMTAIGLSISIAQVRQLGWRPLCVAFTVAAVAALGSMALTAATLRG